MFLKKKIKGILKETLWDLNAACNLGKTPEGRFQGLFLVDELAETIGYHLEEDSEALKGLGVTKGYKLVKGRIKK